MRTWLARSLAILLVALVYATPVSAAGTGADGTGAPATTTTGQPTIVIIPGAPAASAPR